MKAQDTINTYLYSVLKGVADSKHYFNRRFIEKKYTKRIGVQFAKPVG